MALVRYTNRMPRSQTFRIEHDGDTWSGEWSIRDGKLHVDSAFGSKSADPPGKTASELYLAERLLRELVVAWRSRNRI